MKNLKNTIFKQLAYVLFFVFGIILFICITNKIYIPIYETVEGEVHISENKTIIKSQWISANEVSGQIFYYTNRDEWVECIKNYDENEQGYVIENIHNLDNNTVVYIDFEKEKITLFEIILKKAGNI